MCCVPSRSMYVHLFHWGVQIGILEPHLSDAMAWPECRPHDVAVSGVVMLLSYVFLPLLAGRQLSSSNHGLTLSCPSAMLDVCELRLGPIDS